MERFSSGQVERLKRDGSLSPATDIVFDLAAYGNMIDQRDVTRTYKANLMRIIDSTMYARRDAKIIYVSTSSVNLPEQTHYSNSKKAAEEYLSLRAKEGNNRVAIVRPYTVIGVGEQKDHLIPRLIESCLWGKEMPFVADPVHDFLDVDDFVDALLVIKDRGEFNGEIYEVGSGKQHSNQEVRGMVEKAIRRCANVRYVDNLRRYDTKNWCANNERIVSLGWKPKFTLEQTIAKMVDKELPPLVGNKNYYLT